MKSMIIKVVMINCFLSTILKTPMSMMIMLLTQTMLSIMLMNKIFYSSWYSMITFMVMIGGLLVIFMYMSSISSNEKFKINVKLFFLIMMMALIMEEMMMETQIDENLILESHNKSLSMMYNKTFMMLMLMTFYLLLSMISINKVIKFYEGPLRSKTYEHYNTKKK